MNQPVRNIATITASDGDIAGVLGMELMASFIWQQKKSINPPAIPLEYRAQFVNGEELDLEIASQLSYQFRQGPSGDTSTRRRVTFVIPDTGAFADAYRKEVERLTQPKVFPTVRIMPIINSPGNPAVIEQGGGPDIHTTAWRVSLCVPGQLERAIAVVENGPQAMEMARALVNAHCARIEPFPWENKEKNPSQYVSIQVVPVRISEAYSGATPAKETLTVQFDGPDEHTTGWSVYLRRASGKVCFAQDFVTGPEATAHAEATAKTLDIPVEPFPWETKGERRWG